MGVIINATHGMAGQARHPMRTFETASSLFRQQVERTNHLNKYIVFVRKLLYQLKNIEI
ncbi:MAG: hypothetical protein LBS55_08785 [Prevotellaceae bacterium]|jgi:hypothetical protein|nr:hypothetical protein [Prevotellaceae bacterium]